MFPVKTSGYPIRETSWSEKSVWTSVVFVLKINKRLNFADKRVVPICFSLAKVSCFSVSVITVSQYYSFSYFSYYSYFSFRFCLAEWSFVLFLLDYQAVVFINIVLCVS